MEKEHLTNKVKNVLSEETIHEETSILKEDVLVEKVRNVLTEQNPNKPSI